MANLPECTSRNTELSLFLAEQEAIRENRAASRDAGSPRMRQFKKALGKTMTSHGQVHAASADARLLSKPSQWNVLVQEFLDLADRYRG